MTFSDETYNLRIELDTKNCELSEAEIAEVETSLYSLRELVQEFPRSDLFITITYHERSETYRINTALRLPGRALVTGDLAGDILSATDNCVRKLVRRVEHYKDDLDNQEEKHKFATGTYQNVVPNREPDGDELRAAVERGDYAAFRRETFVFEEPIRKRAGRWVQRYPDMNALIGTKLMLADVVEEVFLTAFEKFGERPENVRMGEWLEQLIDPSLKLLMDSPEEEMQNISFARTMLEE